MCLHCDGGMMMNLQELQTIVHHRLPVKIFLLNNSGYRSIRGTQMHFFGHAIGEGPATGVSFPDFAKVASAYGIPYSSIARARDLDRIGEVLTASGPALCEMMVDPNQDYEPRVKSRELPDGTIVSQSLEDMFPYLSREELAENMPTWGRRFACPEQTD